MATADSNISKRSCVIINTERRIVDIELPVFPSKVKSKCPAIIFADNRTAKVPGRITLLIVSIKTIKGIKTAGVPWGTKWANICFVLLIQPIVINLTQRGRAKERVIVMWLVLVKM